MKLVEFFAQNEIDLDLKAETKEEALREMVDLLGVGEKSEELYGLLKKRENLGSTGIGKGVAIPHCRSLVVDRLRVVYGRKEKGLSFGAVDDKPVHHLFLIVAPPVEISNQYLPVLGRIAQFVKEPDVPARLDALGGAAEFLKLLAEKGC